jgi:predicted aconitase with swiveling domain
MSVLRGQGVTGGSAEGVALVSREPIAFNLGVDEQTGQIIESGHELEGQSVVGVVLVFPGGKGSTASSFSLLQLASQNRGPVAMVNVQSDAIVAAGAVLAKLPLVHRCDSDPIQSIQTGDLVRVDGSAGTVTIVKGAS